MSSNPYDRMDVENGPVHNHGSASNLLHEINGDNGEIKFQATRDRVSWARADEHATYSTHIVPGERGGFDLTNVTKAIDGAEKAEQYSYRTIGGLFAEHPHLEKDAKTIVGVVQQLFRDHAGQLSYTQKEIARDIGNYLPKVIKL